MAQPVRMGSTRGISLAVMPSMALAMAHRTAYGSSRLGEFRATKMRSSLGWMSRVEPPWVELAKETDGADLAVFAGRVYTSVAAPEIFRVFAMSV